MILLKYHSGAFHQERSVHTLEGHPFESLEALIQRGAAVRGPSEPVCVHKAVSDGGSPI